MASSTTTIQVPKDLKRTLDRMKLAKRETYAEVIGRLIEDTQELSEETKRDIEKSMEDFKAGRYKTLKQVREELGI
jgi:predicted transcriptional regulator